MLKQQYILIKKTRLSIVAITIASLPDVFTLITRQCTRGVPCYGYCVLVSANNIIKTLDFICILIILR